MRYLLREMACVSALGNSNAEILRALHARSTAGMKPYGDDIPSRRVFFGEVSGEMPAIAEAEYSTRTNQLLLGALNSKRDEFLKLVERYGSDRVAVVLGTSNAGVHEAMANVENWLEAGTPSSGFSFSQLELGTPAEFLARHLGVKGPAYSISTACSSSAKVFASARRLLETGVADAAIVGGADGRCRFALNGFHALGALASGLCRPLAADRDGINLGEGAALFTFERDDGSDGENAVFFAGAGETSDAYHPTAPDPEGRGAAAAMQCALADAGLSPGDVGYINLHGTGTAANDIMEAKAVAATFNLPVDGDDPAVILANGNFLAESTKPYTGHCLGAAGAVEAALCCLRLKAGDITGAAMSNSFAFGGSNASVIFTQR